MSRAFRKFWNYFIVRKRYILVTEIERHELLHISSFQEKADSKVVLQAHKTFKEGSSKVAIHSPSGDTDILLT